MMSRFPVFALALLSLPACGPGPDFSVDQRSEQADATGVDRQRLAEIPTRLQELVDEGRIAGAAFVLARHDGIVLLDAVGHQDIEAQVPMRTNAIFRMASVAKPVTAMGIMALQEEGRLLLRAPLERYLPEFEGTQAEDSTATTPSIWIHGLLTHMSGMASEEDLFEPGFFENTLAEVVDNYAHRPLKSAPGTSFVYSSPGFDILGRVIEVVSGKPYEVFMQDRLFQPLGMDDSGFFVPGEKRGRLASFYRFEDGRLQEGARPDSYAGDLPHAGRVFPAPAFGFYSTAEDLSPLLQMLLNKGMYRGRRVLAPVSVAAMSSDQIGDPDLPSWGFGWSVARRAGFIAGPFSSAEAFGHGGSTGVHLWIDPAEDLAGAFLIHQADGESSYARNIFMAMAYAAITDR